LILFYDIFWEDSVEGIFVDQIDKPSVLINTMALFKRSTLSSKFVPSTVLKRPSTGSHPGSGIAPKISGFFPRGEFSTIIHLLRFVIPHIHSRFRSINSRVSINSDSVSPGNPTIKFNCVLILAFLVNSSIRSGIFDSIQSSHFFQDAV